METSKFSKTEKSTQKQIKNQSHVDCFLWLSQNCAPRIRTSGSDCQRSFLNGGFEASEGSRASGGAEFVRGQRLDPSPGQCPLRHCLDCAPFTSEIILQSQLEKVSFQVTVSCE
jgi:hypothetical protein